jgi:hypothetical protein
MPRAKAQSETSYQLSAVSYQPRKGNRKALSARESPAINRGLSQIMIHRRGAEGAEKYLFCLSGDDDKQKHASSKD